MRLAFTGRKVMVAHVVAGCLALAPSAASAQASRPMTGTETYETHLSPTPVPDGAPTPISGEGSVQARLDGQTLQIDGQFSLKDAKVTGARLMQGAGIGMPGTAMFGPDLVASQDGTLHATVKLARDQLAALRAGRVYVLVTSAKSPAPTGHLWGWLLPAQERVAEDQPQAGDWYLPQGAGLKARTASRSSK